MNWSGKLQDEPEKIEVLDHGDIDEIVEIFMDELPDDFCSLMGPGFLRRDFLPHFLVVEPHIGYVARHRDRVVGFVLGAKAAGYYLNFAKKHFMGLATYSLMACLRDIRRLGYLVNVGRVMLGTGAFKPLDRDLELLYISVAKAHQRTGVGVSLVNKLLQKGRQLGFDRCIAKTLVATEGTNRFYKECGFEQLHRSQGRIWYSSPMASTTEGSAA